MTSIFRRLMAGLYVKSRRALVVVTVVMVFQTIAADLANQKVWRKDNTENVGLGETACLVGASPFVAVSLTIGAGDIDIKTAQTC